MTRVVPISEIAEVNPSLPKGSDFTPENLVSFLPMAAVSENGKILVQHERPYGEVSKGYTYFAEGDVLMAKITPCMENGKATFVQSLKHPLGFGSTEFHVLRPSAEVDGMYLFYMIWNPMFRKVAERNMTGTAGQKRVPASFLKDFKIPLPPLFEQKRLAAILEKADSIRRKRQEAVRLTEELLRSVYAEKMKISRAPEISIGEMLEQKILLLHKDGNHGGQYPRAEEFGVTGVPFLSASCFNDAGGLMESQVQFLNENKANTLKIGWIIKGDVLLAHNATVGRVALYDGRYENALIGTSLTAFRADNIRLKHEFLYCSLRSWSFQNQLKMNMGQTTRNQVPITAQRDLTISLPSIELQEYIVAVQRKMNAVLGNLSAASDNSINLFDSLLKRSFKGEI